MDRISFLVPILLSWVGYSAGVVSMAGRLLVVKPRIIDVIVVLMIWFGVICSQVFFDFNRYLLFFAWLVAGALIGIIVSITRTLSEEKIQTNRSDSQQGITIGIWSRWKRYSRKLSGFQSRMLIYMFYFLLAMPFAMVAKLLVDPLRLRPHDRGSYWVSSAKDKNDFEQMKKQF